MLEYKSLHGYRLTFIGVVLLSTWRRYSDRVCSLTYLLQTYTICVTSFDFGSLSLFTFIHFSSVNRHILFEHCTHVVTFTVLMIYIRHTTLNHSLLKAL